MSCEHCKGYHVICPICSETRDLGEVVTEILQDIGEGVIEDSDDLQRAIYSFARTEANTLIEEDIIFDDLSDELYTHDIVKELE